MVNDNDLECVTDENSLCEDDVEAGPSATSKQSTTKKRKRGIIYISTIPKNMNVTKLRTMLGEFGEIGRIFLQPAKSIDATSKAKKDKRLFKHFTEGWVEFESKRVAKQVAVELNNKPISLRKKSEFYDISWSLKYLPRFKWVHLSERLTYEKAVYKHRLQTEISQARKEANFFQHNLDKSEYQKKQKKSKTKKIPSC